MTNPGPYVRVGPKEVAVADLDALKTIYSTKETFLKTPFYRHLTAQPVASVFSTTDVDDHRRIRRLMAAQMSESSLKWLIPTVTSRVELAIQRMKEELQTRDLVDVFKWGLFMSTDVIGELAFGESFRMLENGEVCRTHQTLWMLVISCHGAGNWKLTDLTLQKNQYIRDLEGLSSVGAVRVSFPTLIALAQKYPLPVFKKTMQQARRMIDYSIQSLERYKTYVEANPEMAQQTFFTKMFKANEDEKVSFSEIVINAQSFIIAGSDTTAHSLTYLIWSICRRPDLRDVLVKEVQTLPEGFTEHDLRGLPFLNQCIEETLRLYSAAPAALPRAVPPCGADLGGYWFPGGTSVATQAYTMHRDPDIFPNPDKFDPYRWAAPTKQMKEAFMPFGRGPRSMFSNS